MRASPACQISLQRFGLWRAGVGVLAAAGIAVTLAWLLSRPASALAAAMAAASALLIVCVVGSLWRPPARSLRWDGQAWQLDDMPGEIGVAIDLGPWMLLRFCPAGSRRRRWVPVQRRGLEAQWHALRCAVYSPRKGAES